MSEGDTDLFIVTQKGNVAITLYTCNLQVPVLDYGQTANDPI
jgi:hypothetical protein